MSDLISEVLSNPLVGSIATAIGAAATALWLAAAWWVYGDGSRRSDSQVLPLVAAAWIVLSTPVLLPLSLLIYRLARPQLSAADERSRDLLLKLNAASALSAPACTSCGTTIDGAWLRCPWCATWLASACAHCGEWSGMDLDVCPFCGSEGQKLSPFVVAGHEMAAASKVPAAADEAIQRRRIISSLRPSSYAASRETSSASL